MQEINIIENILQITDLNIFKLEERNKHKFYINNKITKGAAGVIIQNNRRN